VYSRVAEDTEASIGDVTEELDELRRSFSARLRSETLQRKSENLEKDSKIQRLETILESQLQRDKDKDEKIAELEQKVEAMVQVNETPKQRQEVELHEERTTLLSEDAGTETVMGRGRNSVTDDRIRDNTAQVATSQSIVSETKDDPISTQAKGEIQKFERLDADRKGTPVHGPSLPAKQVSRRGKLSSLLKRKSSQSKIT